MLEAGIQWLRKKFYKTFQMYQLPLECFTLDYPKQFLKQCKRYVWV